MYLVQNTYIQFLFLFKYGTPLVLVLWSLGFLLSSSCGQTQTSTFIIIKNIYLLLLVLCANVEILQTSVVSTSSIEYEAQSLLTDDVD